jgi:hypothetical protein
MRVFVRWTLTLLAGFAVACGGDTAPDAPTLSGKTFVLVSIDGRKTPASETGAACDRVWNDATIEFGAASATVFGHLSLPCTAPQPQPFTWSATYTERGDSLIVSVPSVAVTLRGSMSSSQTSLAMSFADFTGVQNSTFLFIR